MVQYHGSLDSGFAAVADPTRRGILEHLGRAEATITQLAESFDMTLTGIKKHVTVLEEARLVATRKEGRVRTCRLGPRRLVTLIRYPLARPPAAGHPARGSFPLLVFAPGFMQCAAPYAPLLGAWASAGYVVAAVNFPRTDCRTGTAAYEPDVVNQPADMSYVIARLLALSGRTRGLLAGLIDPREVAVAGHSDGADTVASLAANACCADRRLAAAAVMAGAEWPAMSALYFTHRAPPMLLVQGSDDAFNPPSLSERLYRADPARARFYLSLPGATHTGPSMGSSPVERLVARVTLAFFNRFVLRHPGAAAAMARTGNVPGRARLVSAGQPPP